MVGISTLSLGGEDGIGNVSFMILSLTDRLVAVHVFDPSEAWSFITFVVSTVVTVVSHRLDVVNNSIPDFRQVSFRQDRRHQFFLRQLSTRWDEVYPRSSIE